MNDFKLAMSVQLKKNEERERNEDVLNGCALDNDNFLNSLFKVSDFNNNSAFNVKIWLVGTDFTAWVPSQWIRKAI